MTDHHRRFRVTIDVEVHDIPHVMELARKAVYAINTIPSAQEIVRDLDPPAAVSWLFDKDASEFDGALTIAHLSVKEKGYLK